MGDVIELAGRTRHVETPLEVARREWRDWIRLLIKLEADIVRGDEYAAWLRTALDSMARHPEAWAQHPSLQPAAYAAELDGVLIANYTRRLELDLIRRQVSEAGQRWGFVATIDLARLPPASPLPDPMETR